MNCSRFAIFVDGANLAGSFKRMNIRIKFDAYKAFYRLLFDMAAETWHSTFCKGHHPPTQLSRVYWYQLGSMDEWDLADPKSQAHLKEIFDGDRDAKRIFMALAGQKLQGADQAKVATAAWAMCFAEFKDWYETKKRTLDGMRRFHRSLRSETDFIDIIECGHWKVDLIHKSLTEKGVDTSLAVDMVSMIDTYDVAIVVSGDADSIPGINYVKSKGRHVGVVEFLKGYPPEKKGRQFSSKLNIASDFVTQIYEMDLVKQHMTEDQNVQQEG